MAEWDRQTSENISAFDLYETLFHETSGTTVGKLEAFAKFTRRQALSKFLARAEIFKRVLGVHGSILDLGVNSGQSLFTWAQLSAIYEPINYTREIIGFDTFEGIPSVTLVDRVGNASDHAVVGGFRFDDLAGLDKAISAYDSNRFLSHIPKIRIVKGDIEKTLPKFLDHNPHLVVSLLHIDVDVYAPTKAALDLLPVLMPRGSIIVFDEVNQRPYPGETQAVKDTLGLKNLKLERLTWETGLSFAVL
jgi:hypothetical protein